MNSGRVMNMRVTIPAESRRMNVGKDVIRILGSPAYICILQRKDRQSIAITPCAAEHPMSFKVPDRLLTDGQWSDRLLHAGGLGLPLVAAYTSAMGWALTVGEGPGMSLQFTLPAAPPLDGMVLTSPTERLADRQNRRRLIRRELAVLVADTSMQ